MKKSLLALAVLGAFAASAQAQTSVTVYGSFDGGVRHVNNTQTGAFGSTGGPTAVDSRTTVSSNGTYNSNRLGFRGTEDLGGGLQARFTLESGFNTGNGAFDNATNNIFNRTAAVGIGGAWGGIDIGRQYSVAFKTIGAYDPFNYKYTGIIPLAGAAAGSAGGNTAATATAAPNTIFGTFGGTRFNNDIQYTGAFGPVTVRAEYALGEQVGSVRNGSAAAVGASFATGPFSFGGAYTSKRVNTAVGTAAPTFFDNTQWTVGGAFKTGPIRVAAGYIQDEEERAAGVAEPERKNAWVGASYAITPAAEVSAALYQTKLDTASVLGTGRRDLFIVGATYALSKRTNFYADVDVSRLKGVTRLVTPTGGVEDRVVGVSVGINHLF